jgi:hypothetical protein
MRFRSFALTLVLPLIFAGSALAAPPTVEVFTIDNDETVDSDLCGFEITFIDDGSFKVRTYTDSDGNVTKEILTNFRDRFTATATANGKTLVTNYPAAFITTSDTEIQLGLRNAYHVPGAGLVLLDAGRVVFDVATGDVLSRAGQHQFLDGDAEAFCAYFAS